MDAKLRPRLERKGDQYSQDMLGPVIISYIYGSSGYMII